MQYHEAHLANQGVLKCIVAVQKAGLGKIVKESYVVPLLSKGCFDFQDDVCSSLSVCCVSELI